MTVMYRWPLWTSGRYDRFYCIFNLRVSEGIWARLEGFKLSLKKYVL